MQRLISEQIKASLARGKNILLLGPRQTGKTTLVKHLPHDRYLNLMEPELRQRYEANPGALIQEIKVLQRQHPHPVIIIDEIQNVPQLTDSIQVLIDEKNGQFILTGSSARKIKNLLPGRVLSFQMTPLILSEILPYEFELRDLLENGSLPGIFNLEQQYKQQELISYVTLYLEEEIRKEALVRNLGAFANFLRLACIESGNIVNFTKISQEIGVSHSTIVAYYSILQDCMLIEKIEPLTQSDTRRRLVKAPKYLIFDLGVRRVAAQEVNQVNSKQLAHLFEQFVGLELVRHIKAKQENSSVLFWRDHSGAEVDYVIRKNNVYTPIEVKWTTTPTFHDARHLAKFQQEYPVSTYGYIICQTPYAMQLSDTIIALPWQDITKVFG